MGKTVDEILEEIGQMGRFQISRLAIVCLLMFPATLQFLNMYFIGAEAPWQCAKNSTVCKLNGSFIAGYDDYDFRCKINRSDWEYASYEGPQDSIISEFDLICDDAVYGWLGTSITPIGEAVFTVPLGIISDRYGRLKILYPCLLVMITVGFSSAFASKYWQFLVSKFFSGAVTYGVVSSIMVLSGEFVGPRYRPLSQTIMWVAYTFELLILVFTAYFVRTWRTLAILSYAPFIFILILWKFTPESSRWYLTHDKADRAEKNLRTIAKVNKTKYPEESLKIPEISKNQLNCLALFSTRTLVIGVIILCFGWLVNSMVYYGASYGASDFGGNMYFNFALTSLIEIPAHILAIDNCGRFGRKKTVIIYMIVGGAACFIVSLIPAGTEREDFIAGRVAGGIVGKGLITVSFDAIVVWSTEFLPTVVRNSGMALFGVCNCIGAASAPFVLGLKRIHPTLAFGLMGGLSVFSALLCLILAETRGMPTAEVIEDSNVIFENYAEPIALKGIDEDAIEKSPGDLRMAHA